MSISKLWAPAVPTPCGWLVTKNKFQTPEYGSKSCDWRPALAHRREDRSFS